MKQKKVLVIIPDGVSLRNFLFTDFPNKAREVGLEIIYWNATGYDIATEGEKEIKLKPRPRALTDLLKRARIIAELEHFKEKFSDEIYDKYKFPASKKGIKNNIKNLIVSRLTSTYHGEEGLKVLREKMVDSERKSGYYKECKELLEEEIPDLVFCTNQRPVNAIAPVTAAQDLGIPTACFIFSWDNLPKATKIIETDHYFVWSEYMQEELMKYYPNTRKEQIKVTGTPQFEIHFKDQLLLPREEFYKKYHLDPQKKYLCFSGDDITTSPHDEVFLGDVAGTVRKLNNKGKKLGIIFRRCPVDFSERYDEVLSEYPEEITAIDPVWNGGKDNWDAVMPTREDLILQTNIIAHSLMVLNVGSSMVFDFAARQKPCAYINYKPEVEVLKKDIREVYRYVHFRSMPTSQSVFWINSEDDISQIIENILEKKDKEIIQNAITWSNVITEYEKEASKKIATTIFDLSL